jgi:hypothetical protein
MSGTATQLRLAVLAACGIAGALLLPAAASADAITSANASALLSIEEIIDVNTGDDASDALGSDITAIYYFDVIPGNNPLLIATTTGNAIASAGGTPASTLQDELFSIFQPIDQQSGSVAEAYYTKQAPDNRSTAYAASSVEGVLEIENTTGDSYALTIGYEILLQVMQALTGVGVGVADGYAYAFAEYAITDLLGQVDVAGAVDALAGGPMQDGLDLSDAFTLTLDPFGFNAISIQLNTQADAEFRVPAPATGALLALGLIGLRTLRRRAA